MFRKFICGLLGHDWKWGKPELKFGDTPLDREMIKHGGYPDLSPNALMTSLRSRPKKCKRCGKEGSYYE